MNGEAIVFRTSAYGELARYGREEQAAFEVDELDTGREQGWSVLATGRLQVVTALEELARIQLTGDPQPWSNGMRRLYIKLAYEQDLGLYCRCRRRGLLERPREEQR